MNDTDEKSHLIEEKMRSVLSDPESMQKLMRMATALAGSGIAQGSTDTSKEEASSAPEDIVNDNADVSREKEGMSQMTHLQDLAGFGGKNAFGGKHTALLHALKPYLGAEKQKRVDRMLKLMQLATLAEKVLKM